MFEGYVPGYNYVTGSYDDLNEPPNTDVVCKQYIPQDVTSQQLYEEHRLQGLPCYQAMINVLNVVTGQAG